MMGDNQQTADNYNALLKVLQDHTLPPTFEWLKGEVAIEATAFLTEHSPESRPDVNRQR
jgi:hypothetical protein